MNKQTRFVRSRLLKVKIKGSFPYIRLTATETQQEKTKTYTLTRKGITKTYDVQRKSNVGA